MKSAINVFSILIFGLLILLITCCSYGNYVIPKFNDSPTVTPEIGILTTASLGETIITMGTGHFTKAIRVLNNCSKKDYKGGTMHILEGVYQLICKDKLYEYYMPLESNQTYWVNIYGEERAETWNSQIRLSSSGEIKVIFKTGSIVPGNFQEVLNYEIIDSIFVSKTNSFQQTMIYNGKSNNIIKFSYREFMDNYARDSFTAEVTYDLSESKIIGYKGFKAEIIEATNSELRYRIISGF